MRLAEEKFGQLKLEAEVEPKDAGRQNGLTELVLRRSVLRRRAAGR